MENGKMVVLPYGKWENGGFTMKNAGLTGVGKCPVLGILNITFKYLLVIISPIVG